MKYTFRYKIYCGKMEPKTGRVEVKTASSYTEAKNNFEQLIEIENSDIINEKDFIMIYECEELRSVGEFASGF
jgi:hypothetical protein